LQKTSKIIMGIDPGTLLMGYGIIKVTGNDIVLIEMDVLKLSGKKDNYERLQLINRKITEVVNKYKPNQFAIEAPFFGKNVQSMLKLGRAQGVAIAAAMTLNIPVAEYSPKKVKQSITGNGNADKEQVWKMVQHIFKLKEKPMHFDATDAVAVALCHHYQSKFVSVGSSILKTKLPAKNKKADWGNFAANNPGRVVKRK
jgi:crossover junction endodeoxyribonuclease RuvC